MSKSSTKIRRKNNRKQLLQEKQMEADRLTAGECYSERALARKMRLEQGQSPGYGREAMSTENLDYIMQAELRHLTESANLTEIEAFLLELSAMGWKPGEMRGRLGLTYREVNWHLRIMRAKLARSHSPYDGLWEVYWNEVHRYGYRKWD